MSRAEGLGVSRAKTGDTAARETWRLRREIYATRGDLDRQLEELQRRRRELTDVKLQVRRHPGILVAVGAVAAAAIGGALWKAQRARKRRAVSGLARAFSSLGNWGNVSRRPSDPPTRRMGGRLLGLLAKAALPLGVALAKGLLRRAADSGSRRAAA